MLQLTLSMYCLEVVSPVTVNNKINIPYHIILTLSLSLYSESAQSQVIICIAMHKAQDWVSHGGNQLLLNKIGLNRFKLTTLTKTKCPHH